MTNPDLAALSEAATEGPWFDIEFGSEVGGKPDFHISCTWQDFIGVASMDNGLTSSAVEKKANAVFIVALVNAYRSGDLVHIPGGREGMREWVADLDMACELIQEAKGADGPKGGFVTDHLDDAENWLDKVRDAIAAILGRGRMSKKHAFYFLMGSTMTVLAMVHLSRGQLGLFALSGTLVAFWALLFAFAEPKP